MLATIENLKPSPFRPPKTPLRSLPPPKVQHNAMGQRRPMGHPSTLYGGSSMNGQAPPFAPANHSGNQHHADPHANTGNNPMIPKPRQMHAPPSALGAAGGAPAGGQAPAKPMPPVPQSKALPIVNKQTGEAVANNPPKAQAPQPPAAIEAPLDSEAFAPIGRTPPLKPAGGSKMPSLLPLGAGGESDSEMGSSTTRFGASSTTVNPYADVVISEASIESMEYTKEEMLSLKGCGEYCPEEWSKYVIASVLPRLAPGTTVPTRLKLLKDAPDHLMNQERGGFGSAASATNALNAAAALRLRQVKETHQKVMSVLSRITPEKYEALKEELMNLPLRQTDEKQLRQVVEVFFEKAVQEPVYSQLYAALVSHMCHVSEVERQLPKEERDKLFASRMRRELLNKCQEEFSKPYTSTTDEAATMSEADLEATRRRFKKRLCGNIKFVCELYARTLVTDRVVDNILTILCAGNTDEDYVAEAIATTITSAGSIFSRTKPEEFDRHMAVVTKLKTAHPSARIRFLMMDVEDSRKRGFERKNQVMTQEELDKQQFLDQKKLQEDMERALKEQNKQHRRQKKTIPSVPSSPVTPARQAKLGKGRLEPHTPTSGTLDPLPSPTSPPAFPKSSPGGLYSRMDGGDSTASLSSLGGPVAPLTKDQTASRAKDMMSKMSIGSTNSVETSEAFEEMDKLHRGQILTGWLRLASTTTKFFTEREQLPGLFAAFLNAEEAGTDTAPFTSGELSKILHDWVLVDIDSQQYDNCPRMFSNWAGVVENAAKYNNIHAPADAKVDPASILHPGLLNLFLQEYRRQAECSSVVESFSKDVIALADAATSANLEKVQELVSKKDANGNLFKQLNPTVMTLLQRFRPCAHLAYVEATATESNASSVEEVLKKLLENKALKDDLELNLFKVYSQSNPKTIVQEADQVFSKRKNDLSAVHNLLKAASAATAVLLPFQGKSLELPGADQLFTSCRVTAERAEVVARSLRSIHNKIVLNMSAAAPGVAEYLCGTAVLTEALQHAAFAVSSVTDRSTPISSPNTQMPKTPSSNGVPLPRSASGADLRGPQNAQLEFEQHLTGKLTTKLCDLLVSSKTTSFVNDAALSAVRGAVGNIQQDVWAVSPPSTLRPILGNGVILPPSESSLLLSSEDLTSMGSGSQLLGNVSSPSKITPTSSPLHSKAIATSMLSALAVTAH